MIDVNSNLSDVLRQRIGELQAFDRDALLRRQAMTALALVRTRVHQDGKASDGSQIGVYSAAYMKVRTGNYPDSARTRAGGFQDKKKKGQAGAISKGPRMGAARPVYNRSADTKVILSLTRQMEADLSVIPMGEAYGVGYNNSHNYDKSQWTERTYGKKIWNLTLEEKKAMAEIAQNYVDGVFEQ